MRKEKLIVNSEKKTYVGAGLKSAQEKINKMNVNDVGRVSHVCKIQHQKGITLVALVITIIILLILAGVTLSITMGENGLFKTAKQAGEETKKQAALETMNIKIANIQTISYAEKQRMPTLQELADNLCEDNEIAYVNLDKHEVSAINEKITVGESTSIYTKLEKYPYEFEIDNTLQIKSIDGVELSNDKNADSSQGNTESGEGTTEVIPEGYLKPSGTKEIVANGEYDVTAYEKANVNVPEPTGKLVITEVKDNINVKDVEYVDTTSLYTKDQVQSGEGNYWASGSVSSTAKTVVSVNVGFVPSKIVFTKHGSGATLIYNASIDPTKVYTCSRAGITETTLNSGITDAANIRSIGTITTFYAIDNSNWEWFAIK